MLVKFLICVDSTDVMGNKNKKLDESKRINIETFKWQKIVISQEFTKSL